jgi:hypothetical protein
MYENPSQHINIPKGGDKKMDEVQRIKMEIEKAVQEKGLDAIEDFFSVEEVKTEEQRKNFNKIWKKVWEEEGYYDTGETVDDREKYYNQYQENSKDIILFVKDAQGNKIPIGTMRLTRNEGKGLPAFNEPEFKNKISQEWKEKKSIEFTLLTLVPEWRGIQHLTSFMLWREGYRYVKEQEADQIVLITDEKLVSIFKKVGFPLHELAEPTEYEGGMCGVYSILIDEVEVEVQKSNPPLFHWFTKGIDPNKIKKPEE